MTRHLRSLFALSLILLAARATGAQFSALVFSDLGDKWHHTNVPHVRASFEALSKKHFFEMKWVETTAAFATQTYAEFDVIVFVSAHPSGLPVEKREEFQRYLRNGGGIVGVHYTSTRADHADRWPWWEELLGRVILSHPPRQSAVLTIEEPEHPSCLHLGPKWLWTDEWYEFATPFPSHLNVLLTVDEQTYKPGKDAMGDWHPVAWYHVFEGGRIFYTSIGHNPECYDDASFMWHVFGGMHWAVGDRDPKW